MFDFLFIALPFTLILAFTVESNYQVMVESESIDSAEQAAVALSFLSTDDSASDQENEDSIASAVYAAGVEDPHYNNHLTSSIYNFEGYRHELVKLNIQPLKYLPFTILTGSQKALFTSLGHYISKKPGDDTVSLSDVAIVLNTGSNYDEIGNGQDLSNLKSIIYDWSYDYLMSDKHPDSGVTFLSSKQRTYDDKYGCVSKLVVNQDGYANIHFNEWYNSGLHVNNYNTQDKMREILESGRLGKFSDNEINTIVNEWDDVKKIVNGSGGDPTSAASATGNGIPYSQIDFDATIKYLFDDNPRKEINGKIIYGLAVKGDQLSSNYENLNAYNTCREPEMDGAIYPANKIVLPSAIAVDVLSLDKLKKALDDLPDDRELGVNPIEGIMKGAETLYNKYEKNNNHKKLLVYIGPVRGSNDTESILSGFTGNYFCNRIAKKFKEENMNFNLVYIATGNGSNEKTSSGMDACMRKYNSSNFYALSSGGNDVKEYIYKILNKYVD